MKGKGLFITGTDTGIGKTRVAVGLLTVLTAGGHRAVGMKPIASGARAEAGRLLSDDALALRAAGNPAAALQAVNPYCFAEPISPNIAASAAGVSISVETIRAAAERLAELSDILVIEGVGGWRVPIDERLGVADLVRALDVPVVMVVGVRLGCINHACLTAEAIQRDGVRLLGWVGNQIEPEVRALPEVVDTLKARIPAPCLAVAPYVDGGNDAEFTTSLEPVVPALLDAVGS